MSKTLALYDIESNGLLKSKREKNGLVTPPMDRVWCIAIILRDLEGKLPDRRYTAADQEGYIYDSEREGDKWLGEPGGWKKCSIVEALNILSSADIRVGHNIQDFDERALKKVYPWWTPKPGSQVLDTLVLSRLIYPDIHKHGPNKHKLFPHEMRLHSLEAWGKRLGEGKADYTHWCKEQGLDPWSQWRPEMQDYMNQDVEVLDKLFKWLWSQKPATTAVTLEHEFAAIIRRLESRGWAFDRSKAEDLFTELQVKEAQLETDLIEAFGSFFMPVRRGGSGRDDLKANWKEYEEDEDEDDEDVQATRLQQFFQDQATRYMVIPTKTREEKWVGQPDVTRERLSPATGKPLKPYVGPPKTIYTQGCPYTPVKLVQFNPSSRAHIWQRLMYKYDWVPTKLTPGGKNKSPEPVVDEDVLRGLPYPEADLLAEYFLVLKRMGQLATGAKAWMKKAEETELANGEKLYRIHGRINTNGAATGRCTHSDPNLAQVPKNTAATRDYPNSPELHGHRCRDLFIAGPGYIMAGFDGAGLELRMLAHYISPWDKGEYASIIVNGKKEEGTDPHSWLRDLIGTDLLGEGDVGRDRGKTCMYTELFGGGAAKLGATILPKATEREQRELGIEVKRKMAERFVAKTKLQEAITATVMDRGFLLGLDGRVLRIRKPHAALNTLLQSAGAVVMKRSLVVLDMDLQRKADLTPGHHYEFVGNIHDEAQAEILPDIQDIYEEHALACLPQAGQFFRLKCPLASEVSFGSSWMHTH